MNSSANGEKYKKLAKDTDNPMSILTILTYPINPVPDLSESHISPISRQVWSEDSTITDKTIITSQSKTLTFHPRQVTCTDRPQTKEICYQLWISLTTLILEHNRLPISLFLNLQHQMIK